MNVVVVSEDNNLIERLENVLKRDSSFNYYLFNDARLAMECIEDNKPEIGIMSLDMTVMTGEELAEYMLEFNLGAKLCFIFNERNIEDACSLFNRFNKCRLIEDSAISADDIKSIASQLSEEYVKDDNLRKEIDEYREIEKASKKKMNEMSEVLNARIDCYNSLNEIIVNSIQYLCQGISQESIGDIVKFLNYLFAQFIQDYLIEDPKINETIDSLINTLNDTDNQRHYTFIIDIENNELASDRICFSAFLLSHMFADFLERYRIKLELKENDNIYRLDFLVDIRLGNPNKEIFDSMGSVSRAIINSLCDRLDYASKDGIIQYRMYYKK